MTRLVYHAGDDDDSPFDTSITDILSSSDSARIACPYIGLSYFQNLVGDVDSWRLLTDVEAWIGLYRGEARHDIQNFIETHSPQIHHVQDLHAKVVLGDEMALVGSANLTTKGISQREEMGVLLDAPETIAELSDWYDTLWSNSDTVDTDVLSEIASTSPSSPPTTDSETPSLSSSAPRINTSIPSFHSSTSTTKEVSPHGEDTDLVELISRTPDREWIESYLDLMSSLISETGLDEDDPRIVTTMKQSDRIAVIINQRYVLGTFFSGTPKTGFILPDWMDGLDEVIEQSVEDEHFQFKRLVWEDESVSRPHWLEFTRRPDEILAEKIRRHWMQAALAEADRASQSSYSSHDPQLYRLAVNRSYRKSILDRAF
ncbi:phospholipase D-like domain-containing protein [Haloarcula sp. GH36]|uniref:phospholipase D-like domain-containing protein n=1 Tax=Haloarcula montana TaxID=3111776 RepID=UPI002D798375|nr:phospholipase D-like domain-containing protein [Haloarcula sp. GH36]